MDLRSRPQPRAGGQRLVTALALTSLAWLTALVPGGQLGHARAQDRAPRQVASAPGELPPTAAPDAARRLVVLHRGGEGLTPALRTEVDRTVLAAVTARVHFDDAFDSKVPFEDIELAAGCTARDADCMQRIALSLDADWLLVRDLFVDSSGHVYLTLSAHDGPRAIVTRRAVAQLGQGEREPARVVPLLIERLYAVEGPSQVAEPRIEQPDVAREQPSPLRVLGWSSAALGSGLLVGGIAVGALSRRDHSEYKDTKISVASDVDRASDLLGRAQRRASTANGLLLGGAVVAAAGTAALLWSYLRPRQDARSVRVDISPARAGAALSLSGAWRGGL